ncbi:MAG: hypothetical protein SWX82_25280 [Cyanobacteriota bacterium]|nr:hypothetical protein [Cyanobacteriota bacterium]
MTKKTKKVDISSKRLIGIAPSRWVEWVISVISYQFFIPLKESASDQIFWLQKLPMLLLKKLFLQTSSG